jgi:hypothetical protein
LAEARSRVVVGGASPIAVSLTIPASPSGWKALERRRRERG